MAAMTEDALLNVACIFEEEFPAYFKEITAMIQAGSSSMTLAQFLVYKTMLPFTSAVALVRLLKQVTPVKQVN